MKIKADLHNHLRTASNLRQRDFNKAVDLARQRLGENGIFAMVNFSDRRYEHFIGLRGYERDYLGENRNAVYVPEKQVLVVKGQEIPTQQGHLLVLGLGYDAYMKEHKSIEYSLDEAKNRKAIAIADHPYAPNGIGPYLEDTISIYSDLTAWEIHNGETLRKANQKARTTYEGLPYFYPQIKLGALSSSDGHSFHELGTNWTEIEMPDIIEPSKFLPILEQSIRSIDLQTLRKERISYRGIIGHMGMLALIIRTSKIGLGKLFETDKPEF